MRRSPSSLHLYKILFLLIFNLTTFAQEKIVIKDSIGNSFEFKSPPQKIISLSPAITEILFYIGAGDRIVGVTRYCDFPEDAKKKEKIGGLIDINIEKILRIKPDIVFATRGNPIEIIEKMKVMGIKVFAVDIGGKIEDIFEAMRKVSIVTGNFQRSREKIFELEKKVKEIEKKAERIKVKRKIFLKLGSEGLWTCGKRTYINDLILKAGCKNIGDFKEGWFEINIETLISKNPDIIIILSKDEKDFLSKKKSFLSLPGISNVNAVKNDSIFRLNVDIVERPGPRILEAMEKIYEIIQKEDGRSKWKVMHMVFQDLGKDREYKIAIEDFWKKKISQEKLIEILSEIQENIAKRYKGKIDIFPDGEMSFYDPMLDTAILYGIYDPKNLDEYYELAQAKMLSN